MSLAPRSTPPASLTPAVNDPARAELAAKCARQAYDVLMVYAKAGIALEVVWPYQVDEFAAGETGVDVLEHGNDFGMTARRLVCPEN